MTDTMVPAAWRAVSRRTSGEENTKTTPHTRSGLFPSFSFVSQSQSLMPYSCRGWASITWCQVASAQLGAPSTLPSTPEFWGSGLNCSFKGAISLAGFHVATWNILFQLRGESRIPGRRGSQWHMHSLQCREGAVRRTLRRALFALRGGEGGVFEPCPTFWNLQWRWFLWTPPRNCSIQ